MKGRPWGHGLQNRSRTDGGRGRGADANVGIDAANVLSSSGADGIQKQAAFASARLAEHHHALATPERRENIQRRHAAVQVLRDRRASGDPLALGHDSTSRLVPAYHNKTREIYLKVFAFCESSARARILAYAMGYGARIMGINRVWVILGEMWAMEKLWAISCGQNVPCAVVSAGKLHQAQPVYSLAQKLLSWRHDCE